METGRTIILAILILGLQSVSVHSRPPRKSARRTTTTAKPTPTLDAEPNSDEVFEQQMKDGAANEDPYIALQIELYRSNPQWFIQPGRPCKYNEVANEGDGGLIYIPKVSPDQKPPQNSELYEQAKGFCIGVETPGHEFEGVFCNPDTNTCECNTEYGSWDTAHQMCTVLPGGTCFNYGKVKAKCAHGSSCVHMICVCDNLDSNGSCAHLEKVKIPDPGSRKGDPRL